MKILLDLRSPSNGAVGDAAIFGLWSVTAWSNDLRRDAFGRGEVRDTEAFTPPNRM